MMIVWWQSIVGFPDTLIVAHELSPVISIKSARSSFKPLVYIFYLDIERRQIIGIQIAHLQSQVMSKLSVYQSITMVGTNGVKRHNSSNC